MKIRKGFVSNSSSSSFICDACGSEESGMEMNLDQAGMSECEGGHTICCGTLENDGDFRYNYPRENCPCCTLDTVGDWIIIAYLLHLVDKTQQDVVKEITDKFNTESEFWAGIKK